jgi:hypothetical protein
MGDPAMKASLVTGEHLPLAVRYETFRANWFQHHCDGIKAKECLEIAEGYWYRLQGEVDE